MDYPYLTASLPGIGGVIKQRSEDFFVQELPLYEPSGSGEHVYCEIQKIGLTTFEAIDRIVKKLKVPQMDVGYAGLKDANAITRQVFSIRGVDEQQVMRLNDDRMQVQWAARHSNKLRLGHLAGNRFAIKIRDVQATDVVRVRPIIEQLQKRGMPNYFGEQRFGRRNDNDKLGAALIGRNPQQLLALLLGGPDPQLDQSDQLKARQLFDAGDLQGSLRYWPRTCGMERRVLARLIKTGKPLSAVAAVDQRITRLWISALQSRIFNDVLAERIEGIDTLLAGDFVIKHENGAGFFVEDPAVEQPRCDAFEISPTGPVVGYRMTEPQGRPLEIEQTVLAKYGLTLQSFRGQSRLRIKGTRRPLRVRPTDIEYQGGGDEHGPFVLLAFTLPAGSYATVLLREVMKNG